MFLELIFNGRMPNHYLTEATPISILKFPVFLKSYHTLPYQ